MKKFRLLILGVAMLPLLYLALAHNPLESQSPRSSLLYNFHREGREVGTHGSCDFTVMKLADGTIVGTCYCDRGGSDGAKCGISVAK